MVKKYKIQCEKSDLEIRIMHLLKYYLIKIYRASLSAIRLLCLSLI